MIGFIDSGVGGLNVMCECQKLFDEDFIFLCDNKNAPYGNKKHKDLFNIAKKNIEYLIKHYNIKVCVIGCNTISYTVGEKLQNYFNIPILLTKVPEILLKKSDNKTLFFGTKNTIKKIQQINENNNAKYLYIKNLPKKIDNNLNNVEKIEKILKKYLLNKKFSEIKSIILCCTHFYTIKKIIKNILPNVQVVDYTKDIALQVKKNVEGKMSSSFHIVLTDYNYPRYVELKAYYRKHLFDK